MFIIELVKEIPRMFRSNVYGVCCVVMLLYGAAIIEDVKCMKEGQTKLSDDFSEKLSLTQLAIRFAYFIKKEDLSDRIENWPEALEKISPIVSYIVEDPTDMNLFAAAKPISWLFSDRLDVFSSFCLSEYCTLETKSTVICILRIASIVLSKINSDSTIDLRRKLDAFSSRIRSEGSTPNLSYERELFECVANVINTDLPFYQK
jgi:hypothetical protein